MRASEGHVTLIGTAHVSANSVEEVRQTIRELRPEVVCVELDEGRLKALRDPQAWQKVRILDVMRQGRGPQMLAQIFLASYQRRIGERTGVVPGAELLAGVEEAKAIGARVVLADRDVGVTLRRAFNAMGVRERLRISWELLKALVGAGPHDEVNVDDLLEKNALDQAMAELADIAPSAKSVLIDERDAYLSSRIAAASAQGQRTVAVIGAGHLEGVRRHIREGAPSDVSALESVTKRRVTFWKVFGLAVPIAILALFAYFGYLGFTSGKWDCFVDSSVEYVLIVGSSAALGALLAGGHPLSILTAFAAAPITVLHPALAAGWFAGLAEAWRRAPTVADFQGLAALTTFREMRRNRVVRVLLVAAICNLTTTVGAVFVLVRLFGVTC